MTFKVLTAEIYHETNTFSRHPTDEQAFRDRYFLTGAEAIAQRRDANTELAGFLDVGRAHGWQVEHVLSSAAGPSGRVTRTAFDWLCEPLIAAATSENFEGILLGLHGAMVPDFCEDGEGELLRRLRAVVGQAVPIAITLDPHANVSRRMCELADIIVAFKTYPHVDMREIGRQAGEILQRTMAGEIKPRTISARRPMLEEVNGGRTDIGPMLERLASARAYEAQADVFAVSINGGFASADIAEVGPTVLVTGQGDFDAHQAFAETIADDIWDRRHEVLNAYISVEAAAAVAVAYKSDDGPLVIADYADNPGGGGYGDSTNLLKAMLDARVTDACFGPMVDGEAAAALHGSAVGGRIGIVLGGKTDARFGGGPLELNAEIVALSDGHFVGDGPMIGGLPGNFGRSAVLRVDGIEILVVTIAQQMLDLQQFRAFGIDPAAKRVVALKSMQHFRAAFAPIAGKIIVCDSGALCTPHYERMPYRNVPRPIFPLDRE
ncbi:MULTISPECIES: M81 family metallopeptidase [Mesorhizobium]|uniref:M81 family metallopeptidase n=1 Tax=Mesorhizobium TaxID=68287 RepID=UPI0010A960B5|nr:MULTISPECIES: M81 family metallopeptidase [Mesorhizobium]